MTRRRVVVRREEPGGVEGPGRTVTSWHPPFQERPLAHWAPENRAWIPGTRPNKENGEGGKGWKRKVAIHSEVDDGTRCLCLISLEGLDVGSLGLLASLPPGTSHTLTILQDTSVAIQACMHRCTGVRKREPACGSIYILCRVRRSVAPDSNRGNWSAFINHAFCITARHGL